MIHKLKSLSDFKIWRLYVTVCVNDVNFATIVREEFIDICRLSMLNLVEILQETLVEKREIKRPLVKYSSRWK
jgi:hypothetical protein